MYQLPFGISKRKSDFIRNMKNKSKFTTYLEERFIYSLILKTKMFKLDQKAPVIDVYVISIPKSQILFKVSPNVLASI